MNSPTSASPEPSSGVVAGITPASTVSPPLPANSYDAVGRQAWVLLWVAFGFLLVLCIGAPIVVRWYLQNATKAHYVEAQTIRGATMVEDARTGDVTAVVDSVALREGDLVRTDEEARTNVTVYPQTGVSSDLVTVQLRNNGDLLLESARAPRFRYSSAPHEVKLQLDLGTARVTGNALNGRPVAISIKTPHATIFMKDGDDAAITVSSERTEVSDRNGAVRVEAQDQTVQLQSGQRVAVALNMPPSPPEAGPVNLVANGDFTEPLEESWEVEAIVDAGDPSSVAYGTVEVVESGERMAAYIEREGESGIHTETSLLQEINADVLDFDSLILRLDAMVISQSLPGGGQQSSEFPLTARIDFIDVDGNPRFWTWGFYSVDPVANWPIRDGEKIPPFVWYDYESPDFLKSPTFPRPQKVTGIRIYGSGHNYRSMVSGIGLLAQ